MQLTTGSILQLSKWWRILPWSFRRSSLKKCSHRACIKAYRKVTASQGSGQVRVNRFAIESSGEAESWKYPCNPKKHSLENFFGDCTFENAHHHLSAVFRVRQMLWLRCQWSISNIKASFISIRHLSLASDCRRKPGEASSVHRLKTWLILQNSRW